MKRPRKTRVLNTPILFIAFQIITEGFGIFMMVLALSPHDLTFQVEILSGTYQFSTGTLLPLDSSRSVLYSITGIGAFFMTLFFSVAKYVLRI
jgi:hypothetical protein